MERSDRNVNMIEETSEKIETSEILEVSETSEILQGSCCHNTKERPTIPVGRLFLSVVIVWSKL